MARTATAEDEMALSMIADRLTTEHAEIGKFRDGLDDAPAHAFEWGERALQAAVRMDVYGYLSKTIHKKGVRAAVELAGREAMQHVRFPERSTAPLGRLVHLTAGMIYAEFANDFKDL